MSCIFLFDHLYQRFEPSKWTKAMMAIGVSKDNISRDIDHKTPTATTHAAYAAGNIIFCHTQNSESWRLLVQNNIVLAQVIFVHRDGGEGAKKDGDRLHGCYWKPEDFENPTRAEIKEFIQSLDLGKPRLNYCNRATRANRQTCFRLWLCFAKAIY